jgi:hypothetical protein
MPQLTERLFLLITVALAVASTWSGIDALLHQTAYQNLSASVAFAAAAVLGLSAAAVWLDFRARRGIAIFCGCCLVLFTLSSVTLGRDSLEGIADVVTLVASAAAGILAFTIRGRKRDHDAT